jgi:hypothetical protein
LSRIVISAVRVVGRPPHDRSGVPLGVGGVLTGLSPFGVGGGREDGRVSGKHLELLFLGVKRQRETVAVSCDYGPDEGRRAARSTDRRV